MTVLKLQLLGAFRALDGNSRPLDISSKKARAILAILALSPSGTVARHRLANLLWGDRAEEQARSSLRQTLTLLRRNLATINASILQSDDEVVMLDCNQVESDVSRFQRLARSDDVDDLSHALVIYGSEFLTDIAVLAEEFEQWCSSERARLHSLAVDCAERQWKLEASENRVAVAKRLVAMEPLKESAHLMLMQSYVETGEVALALQHYAACRDLLKSELGILPGSEIEVLRQKILEQGSGSSVSQTAENSRTALKQPSRGELAIPQPALELVNKPSIAVLPFQNLSGDPEQEYFADGIVEEITIALSYLRWLFVIARNSSFTYKGRAVNVRQVGQDLGVRYVLEGSVRKAVNRIRIAAQLIDTATGALLWANRFEGELKDIFDLQDQVTSHVVGAIAPRLEAAEIERARRKPTAKLDAYDHFLRGTAEVYKWTREGNDAALAQFYKAIEIDPDYAAAYGVAARTYVQRNSGAWMRDRAREIDEAERLARLAVKIGHDDAVALCGAGFALADICREISDGDAFIDQSLVLNPNYAVALLFSGWVKASLGNPELALERLARARELSPLDPQDFSNKAAMGFAHFIGGRYHDALYHAEAAISDRPGFLLRNLIAAASAGLAGKHTNAQKAMARVRRIDPVLRLSNVERVQVMQPMDFARWIEGLRIAGLPE